MVNQSLAHGLNILLLYDAGTPYFTVAEISRHLNYSQSKTYRLIRTLLKYNLLQENPGRAQYSLGINALRLGLLAQQNLDLASIARSQMEELCQMTKETVLLTAVSGTQGVCLERVESEEPIRYTFFKPGAHFPLTGGASSKILLAHLPEEEWDRIIAKEDLKRYTPHSIIDGARLKTHLREIRQKGFAYSDQEVDRDVRAVAAPVWNGVGKLVAGLSIAGPVYRINQRKVAQLTKLVIEYARKISASLGFTPPERKPVPGEKNSTCG